MGVWDRSFATNVCCRTWNEEAPRALCPFSVALRQNSSLQSGDSANGHLPVLWGVVSRAAAVPLRTAACVFLFKHVQSILSAAVRSSVVGPYQAQALLTSSRLQDALSCALEAEWETQVEDVGQTVPLMDLWIGLHEKLYSRVFNS